MGVIKNRFSNKYFRVTIFGSARIKKGDIVYKEVEALAELLGKKEIDVVTGGGPGLMEAGVQGHKKGDPKRKSRSIGLTIKLPHEQRDAKGMDYVKRFRRFSRRLDNFMKYSNVIVVAEGGVGTLLELFYAWQLVQVGHVCNTPIILLGKQWPPLIKWFKGYPMKHKYFTEQELELLYYAKDYKDAMEIIDITHKKFKEGDKDFCLNYKKYKLT